MQSTPQSNESLPDPALAETVADFELEQDSGPTNFADELMAEIDIEPSEQLFEGYDPEAHVHNTRVRVIQRKQRLRVRKQLFSQGAQFIYGLLILAGTMGLIALAITIQSAPLILTAIIICPLVVWYAAISWRRWLHGAPYVYRLLTSLGEDAEDLSQWRLPIFRSRSRARSRL